MTSVCFQAEPANDSGVEETLQYWRRRLADAWWYERPLTEIEFVEARIRELSEPLSPAPRDAHHRNVA